MGNKPRGILKSRASSGGRNCVDEEAAIMRKGAAINATPFTVLLFQPKITRTGYFAT